MRIAQQGLEVNAPIWVSVGEIERILHEKAGWIVRKLEQQAKQRALGAQNAPLWQDGQYLPWRGRLLQIRLLGETGGAGAARMTPARIRRIVAAARLESGGQQGLPGAVEGASSQLPPVSTPAADVLWLELPQQTPAADLRAVVTHWMQQQALAVFTARLDHFAVLLDVRWRELKLSQAEGRWGSATSSGVIRLHWRLMQMPPDVLDYVVVHELAHLHEMNHGPRFWAWVEKILPDYRQRQFVLKRTALAPW
ncbi:MAG: SprT family zinc-dependent metalloprotease [Brachymonas sp.]|nr:SprT family zinc-dependent metalloprotease [Brachymonas sp.]